MTQFIYDSGHIKQASCLLYPVICRMMGHSGHHVEINYFFVVYSSGSSKIHSGVGLWFWGHSPAGGGSHCRIPCLLAGDGPVLPSTFWNRWNHFRWVMEVWCKSLLSSLENILAQQSLDLLGDLIGLPFVLALTIENISYMYSFFQYGI